MTRTPLDPASTAEPGVADLPESVEDELSTSLTVEEETGLDLSEARAPDADPVMADEESARVVQAPD